MGTRHGLQGPAVDDGDRRIGLWEDCNRGEFGKPEPGQIDAKIQNVETAIEEGTYLAIFPQFIVTATA
jgi:hypothetical protein